MSDDLAAHAPAPTPAPADGGSAPTLGVQIARLLMKAGHLSEQKLAHAVRVQSKMSARRSLVSVLMELGLITKEQVRSVLRGNRIDAPLGSLLLELGLLSPSDLQTALNIQRANEDSSATLADILSDNHFINPHELYGLLADIHGCEHVAMESVQPDAELVRRAPIRHYQEHAFLPIARRQGRVVVVFADATAATAATLARQHFGSDLIVGVAPRVAILKAVAAVENTAARASRGSTPASDNLAVATVNQIIQDAIAEQASDIHIEPMRDHLRVRFRQDGVLVKYRNFPQDHAPSLLGRIKVMAGADIAERRRHQDGRILFEGGRQPVDIRVSFFVTIHGENVVMRLLNNRDTLLGIKELGMAPTMLEHLQHDALDAPSGVVIVTGPTGSGKTTTLYAAVNYLNDAETSVITAEDPVEYVIDGISQCSINQRINLSFDETLRHMVRQDPDVIVIGEIRDQYSAEVAINAALTGHKVLTTFHTEDSIGGLLRLLNMNIEAFLISSTVVSVIAQRLVRRVCQRCAEDHLLSPSELYRLGYSGGEATGLTFKRGRGCDVCRHIGYKGRVAIFELLVLNERVRDAILARKTSFEIRRVSIETSGMVTLLEDGIAKAAAGLTSYEELVENLPRLAKPRPPAELQRLLGAKE